jgi:hypothetical protein
MEASCFEPVLKRMKKQRMDQSNNNQSDLVKKNRLVSSRSTTLTIHIIGASEEAEFWGGYKLNHPSCTDVYSAYAEALTDLVAMYNSITTINLIFIGPNCPMENSTKKRTIQSDHGVIVENGDGRQMGNKKRKSNSVRTCEVILHSYRSEYVESLNIPEPDLCVFYNPGFTCPDYDWTRALDTCTKRKKGSRIPFFATTNTEMEAISDLQFLHGRQYIDGLPATVGDIDEAQLDAHRDAVGRCDGHAHMFFGENPSSGSRVRQSGNMANDLFVKNRWVYGGLFGSGDGNDSDQEIKEKCASQSKNTSKRVSDSRSNPALI